MKTQCPGCKAVQELPKEYLGKEVVCLRCSLLFKAERFKRPPVVIPPVLPSTGNFLTKAWKKTPLAFRSGFLATLGVITALSITLYLYGHDFSCNSAISLEQAKVKLAELDIFFVSEQVGTLRGRRLREYLFSPDVTEEIPNYSLWANDKDKVVGISTYWYGDRYGFPAWLQSKNIFYWLLARQTILAFKSFTDSDLCSFSDESPWQQGENSQELSYFQNKWLIIINRTSVPLIGSKDHIKSCKIKNIDGGVYLFAATAQNW